MQTAKLLQTDPHNLGAITGRPRIKDAPIFGQRLAAAPKNRGWSQTKLAEILGTNQIKTLAVGKHIRELPRLKTVRQRTIAQNEGGS
jgi:hypothetical protein